MCILRVIKKIHLHFRNIEHENICGIQRTAVCYEICCNAKNFKDVHDYTYLVL